MAFFLEKKTTIKPLQLAHFHQLLNYVEDCQHQGWYYGNKVQFVERNHEIKEWIEDCIKTLENK